jgi:hypothetical protein
MQTRIDYGYAHFDFDYLWLRDKEIIHKGDEYRGMLIIVDSDGKTVGWYAYEAFDNNVP